MENITRKIFQQFKDCADIMKANGFAKAEGTRILFEADEKVFGTKIGADIANLEEDDIEELEMTVSVKDSETYDEIYSETMTLKIK